MPEPLDVDVLIVGQGLAAWACVREIARRGKSVAVVSCAASSAVPSQPGPQHRPVGPIPSYVESIKHYGRAGARSLWEAFREDADAVGRLAAELARESAVLRGGGFVLARTRAEALDLAEGEDLLREDGFSGEFLDHFLLEARFDVRGVAAGYWAVDDLSVDERALVEALHGAHRDVDVAPGPLRALELGPRVIVETAAARIRADCLIAALEDPRDLPRFPGSSIFLDEPWAIAAWRLPEAVVLPSPARSWDGRVWWQRSAGGVSALAFTVGPIAPADWVAAEMTSSTTEVRGSAAASRDGLPVIGASGESSLFWLAGGTGCDTACAVAGARWVAAAALEGRDPCPALLRAGRFAR